MRLFIATHFPGDVLRDLNERVARLRPRLPAAAWVREQSQHLTFAFLGEKPDELVQSLSKPLCDALRPVAPFEARLKGGGFFPNSRRARVGWIGLEPHQPFAGIAEALRGALTRNGVSFDGNEFRPHLTLMRIRDPWPPASTDLFFKSLHDFESKPFTIDSVVVFSSKLDPNGAVHTPLTTFKLGGVGELRIGN